MTTGLNIPREGALDFVSLGALVHRLDPGIVPFRKAHECHVHRRSGLQENALVARQLTAAKQSLHARERRVPKDTALTHDDSVFATNRDLRH